MDTSSKKSIHPLIAIAAISVTLFSLAGIATITGLIPTSHSQSTPNQSVAPVEEPSKLASAPAPAATATVNTSTEAATKPPEKHAARKISKPVAKAAAEPVNSAKGSVPVTVAQSDQAPTIAPPPPPIMTEAPRPLCYDCGVIESVREVERKGEGSGLGAAAGGVLGAVLGHQTGGGHGRDAMTVLGAIGGAVAGNQVEKNVKKSVNYQITIRFDDGSTRLITQPSAPAWRAGDRIRLVNGVITAS